MRLTTLVTIASFLAITGLAVLIFHYAMPSGMSMSEEQCLMHCLSAGDIQILATSVITAFALLLGVMLAYDSGYVFRFLSPVAVKQKIFHPPPSIIGSTVLLE